MMKHNCLAALMLATCGITTASAQELWTSAAVGCNITKKLKADVEVDCRTTNALSNISRWSASAGLSYKICHYLKAGAAYTFIYQHNGNEYDDDDVYTPYYWQPRQRVTASLTGSYKIGRLSLSLREAFQYTYHRERVTTASFDVLANEWALDKTVHAKHKGYLRSKLEAEYNIRKCRFTPFVSCEIYNNISDFNTSKVRYTIGTEYKINSRNGVSLFYRYIDGNNNNTNVVGVGYTFKLK
jgi:hypothetical protein